MALTHKKITSIKNSLDDLIFNIAKGVDQRILHDAALKIRIDMNIFENLIDKQVDELSLDETEKLEISKVERKLKRWINKPNQINSIILNLYIDYEDYNSKTFSKILLERLAVEKGINNFTSNFHAMSHIGPKNHAKIFNVDGDTITIWEPIKIFVEEYCHKHQKQNQ